MADFPYTLRHVPDPSDELIEESAILFNFLMCIDTAILGLCGGDVSKVIHLGRAMLKAAIYAAHEYYAAFDEEGRLAGFMLWMPPGQDLFSTPEQRALGINEFAESLSQEGKDYYKNTYLKDFPDFVSKCIGTNGTHDVWWLHMAMVRPDAQRKGIATGLMAMVHEKAKAKGETIACSTTTTTNAVVYHHIGLHLKGERTMSSPWGDWPLIVFALDTSNPNGSESEPES